MEANHDHSFNFLGFILIILLFMLAGVADTSAQSSHMNMPGMHMPSHTSAGNAVDIIRDPTDVPAPINGRAPTVVRVNLTAKEVVGHLDPSAGSNYRYWTFNGKVPAPFVRVRQGDTVEVTLSNDPTSHMAHSVDFHAALGPGGGAAFSEALPGQSKTFSFQATTPGLFVYHCGTPMIAEHIANGMYGLILVEPPNGLSRVDHEYYVMQGELYTAKAKGAAGLQTFSAAKLFEERPEYFVFNGAVDALTGDHALKAKVGETVRIFFGDAGPNRPSSLHMVGEIFSKEYAAGALTSAPATGVQTAIVAPGSAAVLELKATMPGKFDFMDHAMARMAKGLMGTFEVSGQPNLALMHAGPAAQSDTHSAAVLGTTTADAAAAAMSAAVASGKDDINAHTSIDAHSGATKSHSRRSASRDATTARRPGSILAELRANPPTKMAGCLTYDANTVTVKAWPTSITYRLQARPLLFAKHANELVYLTGYVGSVVPDTPSTSRDPSFVVDTVDQLAPSCDTPVTPSLVRKATMADNAGDVHGAQASGPALTMGMTDMAFTKPLITIDAGQAVVWKNTSQTIHDVVDDATKAMNAADVALAPGVKPFGSGLLQPGQSYLHVFTVPGTYRYVCTLHEGSGMKGVIVVK